MFRAGGTCTGVISQGEFHRVGSGRIERGGSGGRSGVHDAVVVQIPSISGDGAVAIGGGGGVEVERERRTAAEGCRADDGKRWQVGNGAGFIDVEGVHGELLACADEADGMDTVWKRSAVPHVMIEFVFPQIAAVENGRSEIIDVGLESGGSGTGAAGVETNTGALELECHGRRDGAATRELPRGAARVGGVVDHRRGLPGVEQFRAGILHPAAGSYGEARAAGFDGGGVVLHHADLHLIESRRGGPC